MEQEYKKVISERCTLTFDQHIGMNLCWSLVAAIQGGIKMDCDGCEFRKEDKLMEKRLDSCI